MTPRRRRRRFIHGARPKWKNRRKSGIPYPSTREDTLADFVEEGGEWEMFEGEGAEIVREE